MVDEGTEDFIDELTRRTTEGVDFRGTSKVGTLRASRREIENLFGKPDTRMPKSTYHWSARFEDGTVMTVYDYYGTGRGVDADEEVEWSVGGYSEEAVTRLQFLGLEAETPKMAVA